MCLMAAVVNHLANRFERKNEGGRKQKTEKRIRRRKRKRDLQIFLKSAQKG